MAPPAPSPASTSLLSAVVLGRVEPRLFTPALRDLSDPESSWGYDFIDFCEMLGYTLDPWQEWLAIHLGELREDGTPRYIKAIVLVARQNGKSMFAVLLVLYWMFIERVRLVFGVHKDRAEAKKAWKEAIELAEENELLMEALDPASEKRIVKQIGEEEFRNLYKSSYLFGAPNAKAARGKTVNRALIDELRTHKNRDCWNSLVPATSASGIGQLVLCLSNEGDESSIVLHEEHDAALQYIETGEGDDQTFLASWSCPPKSDPLDVEALAYANPSMNRVRPNGTGLTSRWLLSEARSRIKAGGRTLAEFKIEHMCMRIDQLNPAIDPDAWRDCGVMPSEAIDMADHRRNLALCFDVASDNSHATLAAAVTLDGITHIEVLKSWNGTESRRTMRADLPGLVKRYRPRKVVWFAGGPAAAVADEWNGKRIEGALLEAIRAEDVVRACMGLEEQVSAGQVHHFHDPLLDQHVRQTQQLPQGDGWRFARRGQAPIDATYAAAGAVHVARTLLRLGPVV